MGVYGYVGMTHVQMLSCASLIYKIEIRNCIIAQLVLYTYSERGVEIEKSRGFPPPIVIVCMYIHWGDRPLRSQQ